MKITAKTISGKTIDIDLTIREDRYVYAGIEIAGRHMSATHAPSVCRGPMGATHAWTTTAGKIAMAGEQAGVVIEGWNTLVDQLAQQAATWPDRLAQLITTRQTLAAQLAAQIDGQSEDRARAWETGDDAAMAGAYASGSDDPIHQARQRLADFDAAHPEVRTEMAHRAKVAGEQALRDAWES